MSTNVYSFLNVQCSLIGPGGAITLGNSSGAAEEGITIEASGDIGTLTMGADGSGQFSLHADKSGKITVRILKANPTNKQLSAMYAIQTSDGALYGQNIITLTDTLRGDAITCSQVAFTKAPSLSYGKEAGMLEWDFMAIRIDRTLGA